MKLEKEHYVLLLAVAVISATIGGYATLRLVDTPMNHLERFITLPNGIKIDAFDGYTLVDFPNETVGISEHNGTIRTVIREDWGRNIEITPQGNDLRWKAALLGDRITPLPPSIPNNDTYLAPQVYAIEIGTAKQAANLSADNFSTRIITLTANRWKEYQKQKTAMLAAVKTAVNQSDKDW